MTFMRLSDIHLKGKRVLLREDLNVPLDPHGRITSTRRLHAALPTIVAAHNAGAEVMVMSHLGRPKEGHFDPSASLEPVAAWLRDQLGKPVRLIRDYLDGMTLDDDEIVVLENCRMNTGESDDDAKLARQYAALCDIYVMDAFGAAHRAQASTHAVIGYAPVAVGGPLLCAELDALDNALKQPARPLLAIVAGSKVSTKLKLLENLISKVDQLIVGGGIANTFIAAMGEAVGTSLVETSLFAAARSILAAAKRRGVAMPLPRDVTVAASFSADASANSKMVGAIRENEMILDIGPQTAARYAQDIAKAGTVVWNGPVGVFEFDAFAKGTETLARAIAASSAFSIIGGGDTLAALDKYGIAGHVSYLSTGGGAFLEVLEGKELPAITALKARNATA